MPRHVDLLVRAIDRDYFFGRLTIANWRPGAYARRGYGGLIYRRRRAREGSFIRAHQGTGRIQLQVQLNCKRYTRAARDEQ